MPFSLSSLAVEGTPFRIAHDARAPSVSADGTLVYLHGSNELQLAWVDGDGRFSSEIGERYIHLSTPVASPDGLRMVATAVTTHRDTPDLWIQDQRRGTRIRLTNDLAIEWHPAWSPDGARIAYRRGSDILALAADGRDEEPEHLALGTNPSWSRDGRYLVYQVAAEETQRDLWYVTLDPDGADGSQPAPILESPYNEMTPQLSPDARNVVYVSDQSGRFEVYATDFPRGEAIQAVSTNGGIHPRWSPNGDAIYYLERRRLVKSIGTHPADVSGG